MSMVYIPEEAFAAADEGAFAYRTRGVCSSRIYIRLKDDGDTVESVSFVGGCNGNLKAISKVVEGMTVEQAADLWEGMRCNDKHTSCPDQLVLGLRAAQKEMRARECATDTVCEGGCAVR